jgi:hypothetical protein
MRRLLVICIVLCGVTLPIQPIEAAQQAPDDCNLQFTGSDRKRVKLRTEADGRNYFRVNGGRPIDIPGWFREVCTLDAAVPALNRISATRPLDQLETRRVTIRAFLLGAKFESGNGDHDIHAEIGAVANWNTEHVVIEIPPSQTYCNPRTTLWGLVKEDARRAGVRLRDRHILTRPVEILVTGYVFLDSIHARSARRGDFCVQNGGRGIRNQGTGSRVRGLWEIHPVLEVRVVGN